MVVLRIVDAAETLLNIHCYVECQILKQKPSFCQAKINKFNFEIIGQQHPISGKAS
jgi:hypothetical protein